MDKILKIQPQLKRLFEDVDETWVAVALINDYGWEALKEWIPETATQHYLIGIDLPTSPETLELILEATQTNKNITAHLYLNSKHTFHPKFYMSRFEDQYAMIVGSGNATKGGLSENIELNLLSNDEELCLKCKTWFVSTAKNSKPLTEEQIDTYRQFYNAHKGERSNQRKSIRKLKYELDGATRGDVDLNVIDFSNQYFDFEHHDAFTHPKPILETSECNNERQNVESHLYQLHTELKPLIEQQGWDLHEHKYSDHIVSSYKHSAYTQKALYGLWLSYGRHPSEFGKMKAQFGDDTRPANHMRLQVIVHRNDVGIWLCVGKDQGSIYERSNFKQRLQDPAFLQRFYNRIKNLDSDYFIDIHGSRYDIKVADLNSSQDLYNHLVNDHLGYYFIIGKKLHPADPVLSYSNFHSTVIHHFGLLLPLYKMIKVTV